MPIPAVFKSKKALAIASGSIAAVISVFIAGAILIYFIFEGLSDVNYIQDSYLENYEQTTIGNAFEAFFDKPNWESREWKEFVTDNKTRIVEFSSIANKKVYIIPNGIYIPKGSKFTIQFTILAGDDFEMSKMQSPLMIEDDFKETLTGSMMNLGFAMIGASLDGSQDFDYFTEFKEGEGGIADGFLEMIYENP